MAITRGGFRRRPDKNEQASLTEPDAHDVRASEDLRERRERLMALDAELRHEHTATPGLGWGGPIG